MITSVGDFLKYERWGHLVKWSNQKKRQDFDRHAEMFSGRAENDFQRVTVL